MKLEPPRKFIGKGLPTVHNWVAETKKVGVVSMYSKLVDSNHWYQLEKGTNNWFHAKKAKMWEGQQVDWLTWEMFTQEIITAFFPITE